MSDNTAYLRIRQLFEGQGIAYKMIDHEPTRTSEESHRVRAELGFGDAMGAKALLVKCEYRNTVDSLATLVVPARFRIDSRIVRTNIPGLRKFRFLTAEEMFLAVRQVPGSMPPFGGVLYSEISALYVDQRLSDFPLIAFNAARLETSMIVSYHEYIRVAAPDAVALLTNDDHPRDDGPELPRS
jgi:Ala-tRNA(Pro) deacylase